MKKSELRKKYLELRRTLSKDEVLHLSEKIFRNFKLQFNVTDNQNVHVFLPIEKFNEINTKNIIEYFWSKKVNVFLPKMEGNNIVSVRYTPLTKLTENNWGIWEPHSQSEETVPFNYVITPLLYCDANGNRIGYGKGFYDKFFQMINKDAIKVGVNFFPPCEEITDQMAYDVKLNYLVTPDEVLSFGFASI